MGYFDAIRTNCVENVKNARVLCVKKRGKGFCRSVNVFLLPDCCFGFLSMQQCFFYKINFQKVFTNPSILFWIHWRDDDDEMMMMMTTMMMTMMVIMRILMMMVMIMTMMESAHWQESVAWVCVQEAQKSRREKHTKWRKPEKQLNNYKQEAKRSSACGTHKSESGFQTVLPTTANTNDQPPTTKNERTKQNQNNHHQPNKTNKRSHGMLNGMKSM